MRGLFVTATDTGVGKTVLSAALLAAMAAAGEPVRAHKPVVTGLGGAELDRPGAWPPDHELLASAAGMGADEVAPLRYQPAVSPHLAAQLAGERIDPTRLVEAARSATTRRIEAGTTDAQPTVTHSTPAHPSADRPTPAGPAPTRPEATGGPVDAGGTWQGTFVVEGVGGLLTPLAEDYSVRDFAVALGLPLLIAARPGLGTINHTLLTLAAARAAGLDVLAVVLTPWPERPDEMERSNRETIARLGEVEVVGLGQITSPTVAELERAGAALPWRHWRSTS